MKTVEQLIFEKRFKDAEFDPNDYNDWAKENEYEAYTLCLAVAKQLQQHLVMQAASECALEAAVGNSAAGQSGRGGMYCVSSDALVYGKPCKEWCGDENCWRGGSAKGALPR